MGNGVVDMEKKIALLNLGLLHVQEKLYHYLSNVMMVMIQRLYAITFIPLQIEISKSYLTVRLLKVLFWMFARIMCKYMPAQF